MKWALNDLKANKGIWAGVLLVLVTTQTVLCAMGVSMGVSDYYLAFPMETRDAAKRLASGLSLVYITAVAMGCLVIMLTIQASIRQRRQGLALLPLLGATPRQVLVFTMAQILVLTVASSLVGLALAPVLAPRIVQFYSIGLRLPPEIAFTWHGFLPSALKGLAAGLITALLGTCLTLRELKRMTPVQMLSRAGGEETVSKVKRGRGLLLFIVALILLLMPLVSTLYLSHNDLSTMSREQIMGIVTMTGGGGFLFGIILMLIAMARSGGLFIGWVTRFWTRLIPVRSPVWKIARSQAVVRSRGKAFGSTVISLTSCMFLAGGLLAAGQTSTAGMRSIPQLKDMTSGGPMELLSGFWAALLIALIGAIASFAISAKERNLDLALSALDGFILMTTGVLAAAAATLLVAVITTVAFLPLSQSFLMVFPWQFLLALGVPIIITGSLVTLFSARTTLKKPAIATIQAAVGE
jgi:putative ABC transport system permease protein